MLKRSLLLPFIFISILWTGVGMAQIQDDFEDNDLENPTWLGNTGDFTVTSGRLRLDAAASGSSYLSLPAHWQDSLSFSMLLGMEFSPSGSNKVRVYLGFGKEDLTAAGDGYFLEIGQSGSDDRLKFYRQTGTNTSLLAEGEAATMSHSSLNQVRLACRRSTKGKWQIDADFNGTTSYLTDIVTDDTDFSEGFYVGIVCSYTSTRTDKFFFDDLSISPILVDNDAPNLMSAAFVSASQVRLAFDEALDSVSARKLTNYSINSMPPSSLSFENSRPKEVLLNVASPFISGTSYMIEVNDLKDLAGNAMTSDSKTITYFIPSYGDVLINEFMADPSPVVGLPEEEFIELYNATASAINLNQWKIGDKSKEVEIPEVTLESGAYLILCPTAAVDDFTPFGQVIGLSLPALNNSGDQLSLKTDKGLLIDQVDYTSSWYQDGNKDDGGYSLERINPGLKCSGSSNWRASEDVLGGTPGKENSIFDNTPDLIAPSVENVEVRSATEVWLTFDERFDSLSALTASYLLDNTISPAQIDIPSLSSRQIQLTFSSPLAENKWYDLSIKGIQDCEGNSADEVYPKSVIWLIPIVAKRFDVLIHEVFADPTPSFGLLESEFLELYNRTENPISLEAWVLEDESGQTVFPEVIIPPFSYLILCAKSDESDWSGYGNVLGLDDFISLSNGGELLKLYNRWGKLIHFVSYSSDWHKTAEAKSGGYSLEMIDTEVPCLKGDNWKNATKNIFATPGQENSVKARRTDDISPILSQIGINSDSIIQLSFSETMDSSSLFDPGNYQLEASGKALAVSAIHDFTGVFEQVQVSLLEPLATGVTYTLEINGLEDCAENPLSDDLYTIALPSIPDSFSIVINEVLFNPTSGGYDFVELYNRGDAYYDLKDLLLGNRNLDGEITSVKSLGEGFLMAPGDYIVLTKDKDWLLKNYTVIHPEWVVEMDLPSYSDAEGWVELLAQDTSIIDEVHYLDDWHFSLLDDKNGISLERIDPNKASQNISNWHSAATSVGGATPTERNSQFSDGLIGEDKIELSATYFSPDNDGYEDFVQVKILTEKQGQTARVSVFNLAGQKVKTLTGNDLLGSENIYQWDGTTEEGEKGSVGVYIFLIEITDMGTSKTKKYKESVVLRMKL